MFPTGAPSPGRYYNEIISTHPSVALSEDGDTEDVDELAQGMIEAAQVTDRPTALPSLPPVDLASKMWIKPQKDCIPVRYITMVGCVDHGRMR